ncbi:MAG TPA: hypothetical protein DEV81_24945, partial [Cyanobacteria bacterium UBA11049]|nr:hypothetical protein [Cyanobacteria bacterium UBA11049]
MSHNLGAILQLCSLSILLREGRLTEIGPSKAVVKSYLANLSTPTNSLELENVPERSGDGRLKFVAAYLKNDTGGRISTPIAGHPIYIVLEFVSSEDLSHVQFFLT